MAKFITGNELNAELEKILENAESLLILISPYIKFHERLISVLKTKVNIPELQIIIVFGKNEDDYSKSMKKEDFNFLKELPNIIICYEKRLHAKYYANETSAILTSMNLYSFSQNNNIEAGVLTQVKSGENVDSDAYEYFNRVIDQSEILFLKAPQFESKFMGFSKKYINSIVEIDILSEFFSGKNSTSNYSKTLFSEKKQTISNYFKNEKNGYCIRTGEIIPFNPKKPFSDSAYQSWLKFKNENYKENYCHFSGEKSNGETTFAKPILRKNWKKSMEN